MPASDTKPGQITDALTALPRVCESALSEAMAFAGPDDLAPVRAFVRTQSLALGLPAERASLLTLAVSELATNTLQHATGPGRVRVWAEGSRVACEVSDWGAGSALGRAMPPAESLRGRGLALVERIGDQVETSSGPAGTTILVWLNV